MSGLRRMSDTLLAGAGGGAVAGQYPVLDSTGKFNPSSVAAGPTFNLLPQNYKQWRKALSNVRAGISPARVFCAGDSTTAGQTASSFAQSYPAILAGLLNSYYAPAALTWAFPRFQAGPAPDPRVTVGGGWSLTGFGYWEVASGGSGTLAFAPSSCNGPAACDTVDIYTLTNGSHGSVTVNANGGATLATINTNASLGVQKTTVALGSLLTAPTINVVATAVTGNVEVLAWNAYNSAAPCVQVANYGVGGSKSSDWASNAVVYGYQNFVANYAPHLTVVDLGINDAGSSISTATYQTNLQTLITRIVGGSGDVLLKSMSPSSSAPYTTFEPTYIPILSALAAANSCALLDVFSRWVSYAVSNPLGYYNDGLHPSTFGYSDVAQAVFNTLRAL